MRMLLPLGAAVIVTIAGSAHAQPPNRRAAPTAEAAETPPAPSAAGVVNLNTATQEELERLPGIGPERARAILELRARRHRFERVEDLMQVRGIGRATLRRLRPMLTLTGPTTLAAPAAPAARPRPATD